MTKYQFLLKKKETGELSILFKDFDLPLKYAQWRDIYAYRFMAEGIAHDFVVAHVPKNPYLCTVNEKS